MERRKFETYIIIYSIIIFSIGLFFGILCGVLIDNRKTLSAEEESAEMIYYTYSVPDIETELETEVEAVNTGIYLGDFELTAYCSCEKCCGKTDGITATGTQATAGRTISVDPDVIPYGTSVVIDGHTYIAEDCGGAIKGNSIDIYFDSHAEALEFGRRTEGVYLE